jgi:uncharacterized protein YrrD
VIVDPANQKVTHLVVKQNESPHVERLVPVDQVMETAADLIRLHCTKDELSMLEPFVETHHIRSERPCYEGENDSSFVLPIVERRKQVIYTPVKDERIPSGELAVRQGARVKATDGHIGRVHEFLLEPTSERITHLVLRKGHLWSRRDLAVPISQIERFGEETIYLRLDKETTTSLPASPVRQ